MWFMSMNTLFFYFVSHEYTLTGCYFVKQLKSSVCACTPPLPEALVARWRRWGRRCGPRELQNERRESRWRTSKTLRWTGGRSIRSGWQIWRRHWKREGFRKADRRMLSSRGSKGWVGVAGFSAPQSPRTVIRRPSVGGLSLAASALAGVLIQCVVCHHVPRCCLFVCMCVACKSAVYFPCVRV